MSVSNIICREYDARCWYINIVLESKLPTDQIMVDKRTHIMNQDDSIDEYYIMGV
jgi:hypothetical protein